MRKAGLIKVSSFSFYLNLKRLEEKRIITIYKNVKKWLRENLIKLEHVRELIF